MIGQHFQARILTFPPIHAFQHPFHSNDSLCAFHHRFQRSSKRIPAMVPMFTWRIPASVPPFLWTHFCMSSNVPLCAFHNNQECYHQTDTTVGFSTLNRCKSELFPDSNCSWRMTNIGVKKSRKSETFWLVEPEPAMLWRNGHHGWIRRVQ